MMHFALKHFFEDTFTPRGSDRFGASVAGRLAVDDRLIDVNLQNLSRLGFMATATGPVPIGSEVALSFGEYGPFPAYVRWALGDQLGCEFASDLDWDAFAAALLMSRAADANRVRTENRSAKP